MMRPDAKVEKVYLYPKAGGFSKIHRRPRRLGGVGYQGCRVRPRAFRFSESPP